MSQDRVYWIEPAGFLASGDRLQTALAHRGITLLAPDDDMGEGDILLTGNSTAARRFAGRVGTILTYTHEVRYAIDLQRRQEINSSDVLAYTVHLGDFPDLWEFYAVFGNPQPRSPDWSDRRPACMFASRHPHLHRTVPEDLTHLRATLAEEGVRRGALDLYGRGWDSALVLEEHRAGRDGLEWQDVKAEVAANYVVQFALENTYVENYVTEKFWQATDSGSIPVYFGSPWMDRFVPPELYLDLRSISSTEELFDTIEAIAGAKDLADRAAELQAITARWRAESNRSKVVDRWFTRLIDLIEARFAGEDFVNHPLIAPS